MLQRRKSGTKTQRSAAATGSQAGDISRTKPAEVRPTRSSRLKSTKRNAVKVSSVKGDEAALPQPFGCCRRMSDDTCGWKKKIKEEEEEEEEEQGE